MYNFSMSSCKIGYTSCIQFFLEITVKIQITCDMKSPVINPPSPSLVDGGFITGDFEITCDLGSRNST